MKVAVKANPTPVVKQPPKPGIAKQCASFALRQISHAVSTVALAPFRIAKSTFLAAAMPVAYVAGICIIAHILIRPKTSLQMAQDALSGIPGALQSAVRNAPAVASKAAEISQRIYHASLQALGNRVLPPVSGDQTKTPHTLLPVLQATLPTIRHGVDGGLTLASSVLRTSYKFTSTTILPELSKQFDKYCPKINGESGSPQRPEGGSNGDYPDL